MRIIKSTYSIMLLMACIFGMNVLAENTLLSVKYNIPVGEKNALSYRISHHEKSNFHKESNNINVSGVISFWMDENDRIFFLIDKLKVTGEITDDKIKFDPKNILNRPIEIVKLPSNASGSKIKSVDGLDEDSKSVLTHIKTMIFDKLFFHFNENNQVDPEKLYKFTNKINFSSDPELKRWSLVGDYEFAKNNYYVIQAFNISGRHRNQSMALSRVSLDVHYNHSKKLNEKVLFSKEKVRSSNSHVPYANSYQTELVTISLIQDFLKD